jgi:hypothetical protein
LNFLKKKTTTTTTKNSPKKSLAHQASKGQNPVARSPKPLGPDYWTIFPLKTGEFLVRFCFSRAKLFL